MSAPGCGRVVKAYGRIGRCASTGLSSLFCRVCAKLAWGRMYTVGVPVPALPAKTK